MAGATLRPRSNSWWIASSATGGSWPPIGAAMARASARRRATGSRITWPIWTPFWSSFSPAGPCRWWAIASAATQPAPMPACAPSAYRGSSRSTASACPIWVPRPRPRSSSAGLQAGANRRPRTKPTRASQKWPRACAQANRRLDEAKSLFLASELSERLAGRPLHLGLRSAPPRPLRHAAPQGRMGRLPRPGARANAVHRLGPAVPASTPG